MDYLNYLPHTGYDELPSDIKATISREKYRSKQRLALALSASTSADLPDHLAEAFQQRKKVQVPLKAVSNRSFPWLAVAGWLLFIIASTLLYQSAGKEKTVYQLVSAPVLPAKVMRDTIFETVTETVLVTHYDTIIRYEQTELPSPQYVYVRDTVYLPSRSQFVKDSVNISRPAARNLRYLELLVETD